MKAERTGARGSFREPPDARTGAVPRFPAGYRRRSASVEGRVLSGGSEGCVTVGVAELPVRRPARELFRLRPGWPLTVVFVGYPLWWVLGVCNFVAFAAAGLMLLELVRRRRIAVPPGFGFWLLFLGVVVVGVTLLQVNAPGALPETSHSGVITWAYRLMWYGAATVALLYVGNMRDELPLSRVSRSLGWMFVVIVAGGWLGVLAPTLDFPSVLELVLPRSVTRVEFIHYLVHPQVVQLYQDAVTDTPRPSAPFAYTNFWGLNYACFLPFFVVGWWQGAGRLRRALVPTILLLSLVPVVQSLNRGLWATLAVAVVFGAVRAAMSGKVRLAGALVAAAALTATVVLTGPAAGLIQTRLDNPTSNEGRSELASQTLSSVLRGSPVVGFGNTRDPQGSFYSIAGGATPECPLCTPPSLGTQGHLWLVVYTQGVLGLLLYLGIFVVAAVRTWRLRSPYVTAALTVLLVHACTGPVYDTVGVALLAILIAVGLTWREEERLRGPRAEPYRERAALATTAAFGALVRRNLALIAVLCLMGAAGGLLWQTARGVSSVGTVSIVLPVEPVFLTDGQRAGTMDNEAQFARSSEVLAAMEAAVGHRVAPADVVISANANTRILNLRYTARTTRDAELGTTAAAETVLQRRAQDLRDRLASTSASLVGQAAALQAALQTLDQSTKVLESASRGQRARAGANPRAFDDARALLLTRAGIVTSRLARAETTALDAGEVVRPVTTRVAGGRWRVSVVSGATLGLLFGLLLARAREQLSRPLRDRAAVADAQLPVLAEIDRVDAADLTGRPGGSLDDLRPGWRRAVGLTVAQRPAACFAVRNSPTASAVAAELERWLDRAETTRDPVADPAPVGTVLLVAPRSARVRDLTGARSELERSGQSVVGVVLV